MARLRIAIAGRNDGPVVELQEGECALVGRDPSRERLPPELASRPVRPVVVPSPLVSGTHLAAWCEGGRVQLLDLGSKNGSFVRLARRAPTGAAVEGETVVLLGLAPSGGGREEEPPEPSWTDASDFDRAVASSLSSWLRARGLDGRITTLHGDERAEDGDVIPLANRTALCIAPTDTVDGRWPDLMMKAWRFAARQNALFESEEETRGEGLILASPAIREAHRRVIEAAGRGLRLLLSGPSGAGKEGLARCYHRHAGRSGPFVARNCSMFTRDLLRSELFGAEAGAFTGCVRRIVGAVERAHGGTLFLDEIGEMSPDVQPMLLRFLDSGEYERMGGTGEPRPADTRVVCATNRDLRAVTRSGQFRQDLWYRLSIQVVEVPPLAERIEDVVAYLRSRRLDDGTSAYDALTPGAFDVVGAHPFAGNFRELAALTERIPRDAGPHSIDAAHVRRLLDEIAIVPSTMGAGAPAPRAPDVLDWPALAAEASRAFADDRGAATATWDDVKDLVETYLKPLAFASLSGASAIGSTNDIDVGASARRVTADRGTAQKQLRRYFERFRR